MLPLKVAILNYAIDNRDNCFKVGDIMNALKDQYGTERQFTKKRIETYCIEFSQNNFFSKEKVEVTADGELDVTYKVTDYACERGNRFIPSRRNNN